MAAVPSINSYVEGGRVIITAHTAVLPSNVLTTPSTWELFVRNTKTNEVIHFNSAGPSLPTGINADMQNPSAGVITFTFDVDAPGKRNVFFKGTGACKCSGKHSFMVEGSDI